MNELSINNEKSSKHNNHIKIKIAEANDETNSHFIIGASESN